MYDTIYNILSSKFELIEGDIKKYFYNKYGQIVATVGEKSITMYYDYPKNSRKIWNHNGKVVVSFIKEFNVNGKLCDIFFIDGLTGACNDTKVHEDYSIDTGVNRELYDNQLQQKLNVLTSEEKTKRSKKISNIYETKFGNCGKLTSENGFASFDICGLIHINNCRIAQYSDIVKKITQKKQNEYMIKCLGSYRDDEEKRINIVQEHEEKVYTDYKKIYEYFRKEYNWYFTHGYHTCGSDKTREYVYNKQKQTVASYAIHKNLEISMLIPEELIDHILNSNTNRSLNSIRLQIIREIKNYIINYKENNCNSAQININNHINNILSRYNFNQRKVDVLKKLKKTKKL